MAVPTPGRTASAAILASVLQAVFVIGGGVPTGQVVGGHAHATVALLNDAGVTVAAHGASSTVALANAARVTLDQ